MAVGFKTGGRVAGTPNRKATEAAELLASIGHDPIAAMVEIAKDPNASLELRGRMNAELAHYVYPRCRAVEQTVPEANVFRVEVTRIDSP